MIIHFCGLELMILTTGAPALLTLVRTYHRWWVTGMIRIDRGWRKTREGWRR